MIPIPHIALFKRHKYKILFGTFVFWLLIGFFIYITDLIAHKYFDAKALDSIEQTQYLLRWILWLLLTPVIILLGLKINIGNTKLPWFILLHILFGTGLLAVEFAVEVAIIKPLAEAFYLRHVDIGEIIIPFLLKYFAYIITYFLIVGVVNMYIYMSSLHTTRLQNKELEYQLAVSQLQTLKMQIHPHFLFNTHHSIIGLIVKNENEKAAQMLAKLSELLRKTIEKQDTEFVPLADELKSVDLYLDIQKIRFSNRFTYDKDISSEAANAKVPYFILQPIVENAVLYGVEKTDSESFIHIRAFVEKKQLVIEISNSGTISNESKNGFGIGLSNVTKRLKQHYGEIFSYANTTPKNTLP
jgi:sensor histidine kinase YesM